MDVVPDPSSPTGTAVNPMKGRVVARGETTGQRGQRREHRHGRPHPARPGLRLDADRRRRRQRTVPLARRRPVHPGDRHRRRRRISRRATATWSPTRASCSTRSPTRCSSAARWSGCRSSASCRGGSRSSSWCARSASRCCGSSRCATRSSRPASSARSRPGCRRSRSAFALVPFPSLLGEWMNVVNLVLMSARRRAHRRERRRVPLAGLGADRAKKAAAVAPP